MKERAHLYVCIVLGQWGSTDEALAGTHREQNLVVQSPVVGPHHARILFLRETVMRRSRQESIKAHLHLVESLLFLGTFREFR